MDAADVQDHLLPRARVNVVADVDAIKEEADIVVETDAQAVHPLLHLAQDLQAAQALVRHLLTVLIVFLVIRSVVPVALQVQVNPDAETLVDHLGDLADNLTVVVETTALVHLLHLQDLLPLLAPVPARLNNAELVSAVAAQKNSFVKFVYPNASIKRF